MRNALIFTIIGFFFAGIFYYVVKDFSPFDVNQINILIKAHSLNPGEWEKLNTLLKQELDNGLIFQFLSSSAYFAFGLALAGIFCLVTAFHLTIDKLFFRTYYEKPSLFDALRRAFLIVATFGLIIFMKLSLLTTTTIVLVPLSAVIIEIIFISTINPFIRSRLKNQKVQKPTEITKVDTPAESEAEPDVKPEIEKEEIPEAESSEEEKS